MQYLKQPWNFIDWLNLTLQLKIALTWWSYWEHARNFAPAERYDGALRSLGAKQDFLALGAPYAQVQLLFDEVHTMTNMCQTYTAMNVLSVILMTMRALKLLDFQPRLGLVTRTLSKAFVDLIHFFLVFALVLASYAVVGFVSFGSEIERFASFERAISTLVELMLGDTDVLVDLSRSASPASGILYFWSFIIVAFFILMNVLLAILVDAYVDVKGEAQNVSTVLDDLIRIAKGAIASSAPLCGPHCRKGPSVEGVDNDKRDFGSKDHAYMSAKEIVKLLEGAAKKAASDRQQAALAGQRYAPGLVSDVSTSSSLLRGDATDARVRVGRAEVDKHVLGRVLRRYGDEMRLGKGFDNGTHNPTAGGRFPAVVDDGRLDVGVDLAGRMLRTLQDTTMDRGEVNAAGMDSDMFQLFVLKEFQKIHANFNELQSFQQKLLSRLDGSGKSGSLRAARPGRTTVDASRTVSPHGANPTAGTNRQEANI